MGAPLTLALQSGESPLAPVLSEPWVTPDELGNCTDKQTVDLQSVCVAATEILFLLSGRKYGVRTERVRPIAGLRTCGWGALDYTERPPWLVLKSPVQRIVEIKVDGEVLDPSAYSLFDNRKLVRNPDANGTRLLWPTFQRLDLEDDELETFSITYQWGHEVPMAAILSARTFACQLAKYINRDSDCALSDRVISITRQGVSQSFMDPSQILAEARTGLYVVDTWLGAVNPHGNRKRPTIQGPDSTQLLRPSTGDDALAGGFGNTGWGS